MDDYRTYVDELGSRPTLVARSVPTLNWRAALAGAVIALAAQIALMLLGAAMGMTLFDYPNSATLVRGSKLFLAIWSLLSVVGGAFAGGVIAGLCARGRSRYHGMLEGITAWSLALLGAVAFVWRGVGAMLPVDGLPIAQRAMSHVVAAGPSYGLVHEVERAPALWTLFGAVVLSLLASVLGAVVAASAREEAPAGNGRFAFLPRITRAPQAPVATRVASATTSVARSEQSVGSEEPARRDDEASRSKIHVHGPLPSEG